MSTQKPADFLHGLQLVWIFANVNVLKPGKRRIQTMKRIAIVTLIAAVSSLTAVESADAGRCGWGTRCRLFQKHGHRRVSRRYESHTPRRSVIRESYRGPAEYAPDVFKPRPPVEDPPPAPPVDLPADTPSEPPATPPAPTTEQTSRNCDCPANRPRACPHCNAFVKARYMAVNRVRGHVLGNLGFAGGTFEGCGWGSGKPGTCVPRGRRVLLADETWLGHGHRIKYRVRIWQ